MKKILFTNLLLLMMCMCVFAQHGEEQHSGSCGHTHELEEFYKKNSDAKRKAKQAKAAFAARLKEKANSGETALKSAMTKQIPVVFHVIYGTCGDGNIEKSRIDDAVQQLNDDFQGENGDDENLYYSDRVGNMDIEFFLAERDPNGNPTTGITRTESGLTYAGVGFGDELRELVMWPGDTYLNVYVVNDINSRGSSGVAIYPEDAENLPDYDGIAMADWAVGPLPGEDREHYTSIISHEVGHWLGLRHIWGNGNSVESPSSCDIDDFDHLDEALAQYVADVENPSSAYPQSIYNDTPKTIGNSTFRDDDFCPEVSGADNCSGEGIDMIENIMDYTRCAVMFSKGQVNYMNAVLEDTIADRNLIPLNASSTLLADNAKRVLFQQATLNENKLDNGAIVGDLDIELVNVDFKTFSQNDYLQEGVHYEVDWPTGFNSGSLQVWVQKQSLTTARLYVAGVTAAHDEDVEFNIVFDNSIFEENVVEDNRAKVIKLDFIQLGDPVRKNQPYDLYVGPEGRKFGTHYIDRLTNKSIEFKYDEDDDEYHVETENPSVEIAVFSNGNVRLFNNANTISGSYTFADATDDLELDISSIADGDEFYIGFRTGCLPDFNYGWVRVLKDDECDRIKILENFIHSNVNQSVTAGQTDNPRAVYDTFTMKESSSGTFSEIEIELRGLGNSYGFEGSIDANDFNIIALEDEPFPLNFSASDFTITVNSNTSATVRLNNPPAMSIDFKFELTFNQSAFKPDTQVDMGVIPIKVDYINVMGKAFTAHNVLTSEYLDAAGKHIAYSNNSPHQFIVQAVNEGYVFFVFNSYPFVANIACKTPNSSQAQLFSCGDNTDNLNFREMGGGTSESSPSIAGEIYVTNNELANWQDDFAYVMLRYDLGCGESLTGWVKLDVSDYTNSLTLVEAAVSEDPAGIELCDKGPCNPIILSDEDSRRMYIEEVILGGVQNVSTHNSIAYQNYTNIVLPIQIGDNWINLSQGNGVSATGAQYSSNNVHWYAFIDFNENDHFDPDELVLSHEGENFQGYMDEIAAGTPLGTYKMRILISLYDLTIYAANFVCNNANNGLIYGETEDYTVSLSNTLDCIDSDNDGICYLNDCDDSTANLPTTPGNACNDNNPTSIDDTVQEDGCTCLGTPTSVMGYCVPDISSPADSYISGVFLQGGGINHTSGNDGGYRDYSVGASPGYVTKAETYTLELQKTSEPNVNFYWKVWIDYNQDGVFDDETEVALSKGAVSDDIYSGEITIPDYAVVGATGMRVYLKRYQGSEPMPCGDDGSSPIEVEDYLINIADCSDADNDGTCTINDCDDNDAAFPATPGIPCNDGNPSTYDDVIREDGCTCKGFITPDATYCTPNVPTNSNDVYISKVELEELEHESGNEGYADFTMADPAYLTQSESHTLYAYKPSDDDSKFYWRVWIDYNQDGDLNDAGELVIHKVNQSNYYILESFTVPDDALDGATLMRIHLREYIGNAPYPCGNNDGIDSEIEDYTVVIGSLVNNCTDADNDGVCVEDDCDDNDPTIPAMPGTACNDGNSNTVDDVILADGCTCEGTIPSCTDVDNDGVCAADDCDDNDASLPTTPGIICNDGNPNTVDDVILADGCTCEGTVITPPSGEYCTPDVPTNNNDVYIYDVDLEQINNSSANEGYGDFTSTPPAYLTPGDNHTLYAYKPQDADSKFYWRVWIDYNQDGDFDDTNELIIHKVNQTNYYILETFTVPTNVPNGATRMRIHLREYITDAPDPCGNDDNVDSEIEDYTVIIGLDECEPFYDISGTVSPGIYKAEDYIESDGQVLTGSSVTFQAGNLVRLLPGFIATAGTSSEFHALIDECITSAPKEETPITEQVAIRNYPNPFTGQTTIEFTLTEDSPVTLWVTDAMGRKVAVLKDDESTFAGTHEVIFDGNNYSPGVYYYTIQAGEYTGTQKMVLIK